MPIQRTRAHRLATLASHVVLAATLVAGVPAVGRAQAAGDAIAARALFQDGLALADTGAWSAAADSFRRALALRRSPVIAYNLGVALAHDGHPVEAAELFREVVRADEADELLRRDASAALPAAESRIAWLTTTWDGDPFELALLVDASLRPIELLGAEMPLDPGVHDVMLVRGDHAVAAAATTLEPGEHAVLELETRLAPAPRAPVDESEPRADRPESDDTALFAGLGVGAGVLVLGGVIVLAVVLAPSTDASPRVGSLGTIEIGIGR